MSDGVLPPKQGLYDPANEHDACGVGFVAHIKGEKRHEIIRQGLTILERLHHRGAVGADPRAGDGAGLLLQLPDEFFRAVVDFDLPDPGEYAVGMVFLPRDDAARAEAQTSVEGYVAFEGQHLIGWRDVPVDNAGLGYSVLPTEPVIRQVFIGRGDNCADQQAFERKLPLGHAQRRVRPGGMVKDDLDRVTAFGIAEVVLGEVGADPDIAYRDEGHLWLAGAGERARAHADTCAATAREWPISTTTSCAATIASGTVDMPTTSLPIRRRNRYSARVSKVGPVIAA